jgi:2-iminobutanoate/2-iminopropanoate deaminase
MDARTGGLEGARIRTRLGTGALILGILAAMACEDDSTRGTPGPNQTIVVEGLGRLPQFSHAVVAGDLIFVSGTLGTIGASFDLAAGGTGPETTQALRNIESILRASGAGLGDVVKMSVYLTDMKTFPAMNKAYGAFFPEDPPARITVGASELALGAAVEIECIARAPR